MKREELIQKLEGLSVAQKLLIIILILVIICGSYWYFLFKPKDDQRRQLEKQITHLEKQIKDYRKQAARLDELQKELKKINHEFFYAKSLLPESKIEVEKLLSEIEKLGKDVGIGFISFTPGNENKKEFYVTRKVSLSLEGSFHNLMFFFNRLSRINYLITINSFALKPISENEANIVLSTQCELTVYRALTAAEMETSQDNKKKKKKRRKK